MHVKYFSLNIRFSAKIITFFFKPAKPSLSKRLIKTNNFCWLGVIKGAGGVNDLSNFSA